MANLREKIEEILVSSGVTGDQLATIAPQLVALGRAKEVEIVHQVGPNGFHRLIVNGEKTQWASPTDIIRSGDFLAATDAYINQLPQVGKIFALRPTKDFKTESVQTLLE